MKHLGDISKINGADIEPVDLITFGSPCQDLSVAGKRAGMKHEANGDGETTRSGLFMEAVRIIKEMREATNGKYPRFALWENVPGAFSSNKGEDFRIVLEELIKIVEPEAVMPEVPKNGWAYADSYSGQGWSLSYRTFDAQYWGVPQRRRRIYLVADFGSERAKEILFEREGLRGDYASGGAPWQRAAADAEGSVGTANSETEGAVRSAGESGVAATLCAGYGTKWNGNAGAYNGESFVLTDATYAERSNGAADREKISCYGIQRQLSGVEAQEELAPTILAAAGESGNNKPSVVYALDQQGGKGGANYVEEVMPTMCSDSHGTPHAVAYGISSYDSNAMKSTNPHSGIYKAGTSRTLDLNGGNPACNQGGIAIVEPVGMDGYNGDLTGDTAATIGVNCGTSTGRNGVIEQNTVSILTPWDSQGNQVTDATGEHKYGTLRGCGGAGYQAGYVLAKEETPAYSMKTISRSGKVLVEQANPICASDYKDPDIVAYGISSYDNNAMKSVNAYSGVYEAGTSRTIDQNGVNQPICMATQQGGAEIRTDDKAPTLTAAAGMSGNNQPVVAYKPVTFEPGVAKREGGHIYEGVAGTLRANAGDNQLAVAFAQNQRDEIRDLGDKAGSLQAQPGMKQQTFIIDSIGGQAESAKETDIAPTLKATHYKFPPSVALSAGFCTEHSAQARSIGYEEETSPTLRAGVTPAVVYDARGNGDGDKAATITGGHESSVSDYTNVLVAPVVYNGANVTSPVNAANPQPGDPCHTLSTDSRNYCVEPQAKLASGGEVTGCLMASGYEKLGAQEMFSGDYTVVETHDPETVYATDIGFFSSCKNVSPSLLARGYKDPHLLTYPKEDVQYIVRRLTPIECARLQGFPDAWGKIYPKEFMTPDEYKFWLEVRKTHAKINGKQVRDYTEAQILAWYNKLHTDSAEYKMWGNGIALPTALYCMEGIAEELNAVHR